MSVKIEPVSVIEINLGLQPNGPVHKYFANRCRARMNDKYVPEDTRTLIRTSFVDTSDCSIHYEQEYAGYQYYGQRKDGTHVVKHYSKKAERPYQGTFWDQKMVSAEGNELVQDVQNEIDRKGK